MRIILFYSDHCVSMEFNWKLNQFHSSSSHIDCDVCECVCERERARERNERKTLYINKTNSFMMLRAEQMPLICMCVFGAKQWLEKFKDVKSHEQNTKIRIKGKSTTKPSNWISKQQQQQQQKNKKDKEEEEAAKYINFAIILKNSIQQSIALHWHKHNASHGK